MEWFDALVARVAGVPILVSEVSANELLFHSGKPFDELDARGRYEAVSRMIERRLLLAEAARFGVAQPSEEEINQAFNIAKQRIGDNVWWIDQQTLTDQVNNQLWMERFIDARIRAFIMIRDDTVTDALVDEDDLNSSESGAQARARVRAQLEVAEAEMRLNRYLTRLLNRETIKRYPLPTP
jgi:hypothetical protein